MIRKIEANKRHLTNIDWLKSYYLFSFADYFDPENLDFGALRVFNDDTIAGESGFGKHEHDNMEIVTIVLEGEITHGDSMGNESQTIKAGEVQRMSAGTGVVHSEMNKGKTPVHLYQIWIMPEKNNSKPSYEQKDFGPLITENQLVALASGQGKMGALTMHTDATIYRGKFAKNAGFEYVLNKNRGVFIYLITGTVLINSVEINSQDQVRIFQEETLKIKIREDADFILIDIPLLLNNR
jgi:redox-sensitive bicupin YhaK (pirin superfamily)